MPVVYGTGVVRGFLAYAPKTPVAGIGAVATVSALGSVSFATNQSKREIVYAPAEYIFAQGPISAWRYIQRGTIGFADGSPAPLNLMLAVTEGTPPTWNDPELTDGDYATVADWTYAADKEVPHRVQFGHYAVLRTPYLIFPDGQVPDLRAGIDGRCATVTFSYGGVNYKGAPPADMLKDMAENTLLGMGLPAGTVITNAGTDGGAASSFDRYMTARGWVLARAFDAATAGDEAFGEVLAACDATCLWDGANLKIIPLCESAVTGNSVTYSQAATAYAFTDDEFVPASEGEDPIEAERIPESDVATVIPVEFGPVYSPDGSTATVESAEVARSLWGTLATRRGEKLSLPCIPIESHAKAISQIQARRSVYNRTRFRWTASWRHIAVQPGDFVTLTHSMMGLSGTVALVEKVEETNDGLRFEAVEWFPGISLDISYTPQPPSGVATNPLAPPDLSHVAQAAIPLDRITNKAFANLWPNPTSEESPPGGANTSTAEWAFRATGTGIAYSGDYVRELVSTAVADASLSHSIPAVPGETYGMEAMGYRVSGPGSASLYIAFRDKSGSVLGGWNQSNVHAAASWAKLTVRALAPANTVSVDFYISSLANGGITTCRFDSIVAKRLVEGDTGIVADSIQTSDYAYTGTKGAADEVATTGARLRNAAAPGSSLPAILASPAGIKIGKKALSETWFTRFEARSLRLSFYQPGGSWTAYPDDGLTSISVSSVGGSGPYYVDLSVGGLFNVQTTDDRYYISVAQVGGSHPEWMPYVVSVTKSGSAVTVRLSAFVSTSGAWLNLGTLAASWDVDIIIVHSRESTLIL